MIKRNCSIITLAVAILTCAATASQAQWAKNGAAVSTVLADQMLPQLTTDGADGAIITWEDWRTSHRGVGVARINAFGYVQWTYNIVIGTAAGDSLRPQITSDSLGGAIVTWHDARSGDYDIYALRILADGAKHAAWPDGGLAVCTAANAQVDPQITSDGLGGAIITWEDERSGVFHIYAQRILADGTVPTGGSNTWVSNGIEVCGAGDNGQGWCRITSDDAHGAIITWVDWRDEDVVPGGDIYAQRVLADGTMGYLSWPAGGAAICTAAEEQVYPKIIPDGAHGAIITWSDKRASNHDDIYAQRISAGGSIMWTADGDSICIYAERQRIPELASNGAGGAIITWMDRRQGVGNWDIYVNGIDSTGVLWDPACEGICVTDAADDQKVPQITTDGAGGAIIVWRHGQPGFYDIYARRVLHDGSMSTDPVWPAEGIAACTAAEGQSYPQVVASGIGGAIIAWQDHRNAVHFDIYAQRIPPPRCTVTKDFIYDEKKWQDEFLFGCPQGDGYTLMVYVDFDDIETVTFFGPSHTIAASDITIDAVDETYTFWNEGDIIAKGPAVAPSYTDTIEHSYVSGCGTGDVPVRLIGMEVGKLSGLAVRSPDVTGNPDYSADGKVTLSDMAILGFTYLKGIGDPNYNECFDFSSDSIVNLSDLGLFGAHYLDEYPYLDGSIPPDREKGPAVKLKLTAVQSIDPGRAETVLVTLLLTDARDMTTMALGIDRDLPGFAYLGWTPNPSFPGTPVVLAIDHDGRDLISIFVLNIETPGDDEIEIGTIEFAVRSDAGDDLLRNGLPLVFAEALDTDGKIRRIRASGSDDDNSQPPLVTRLGDNHPNPFNPTTTLEYSIERDARVHLTIYNVRGEHVRTLVDAFQKRDEYRAVWDGTDMHGRKVASGVYFCRLEAGGFAESKKLVLLR